MELRAITSEVGGHVVVALDGIADLASVTVLHDRLRRVIALHPGGSIVVDVDGAVVLDDVALGLLLGAAAGARSTGGVLQVVCSNVRIRRRLAATRFDHAVAVRSSIV